jgi:hypothetical protein
MRSEKKRSLRPPQHSVDLPIREMYDFLPLAAQWSGWEFQERQRGFHQRQNDQFRTHAAWRLSLPGQSLAESQDELDCRRMANTGASGEV